jgi:hypothetical protein
LEEFLLPLAVWFLCVFMRVFRSRCRLEEVVPSSTSAYGEEEEEEEDKEEEELLESILSTVCL